MFGRNLIHPSADKSAKPGTGKNTSGNRLFTQEPRFSAPRGATSNTDEDLTLTKRPLQGAPDGKAQGKPRVLTIPQGISVAGKIAACEVLIVEGQIEAALTEGRAIRIGESGSFRGTIEITDADISGTFEGALTVRGRLIIRTTGRVTGKIRYNELAVESGGQIGGEVAKIEKREQGLPQTAQTLGTLVDEIEREGHNSPVEKSNPASLYGDIPGYIPRRTTIR